MLVKDSDKRYLSQTPLALGLGSIDVDLPVTRPGEASSVANILSLSDDNGSKMWPEEGAFHDIMKKCIHACGIMADGDGTVYCMAPLPDAAVHADLASSFAIESNRRMLEADNESQRHANLGTRRGAEMAVVMQTETAEARAERDMWSLLEVFTRADLMKDISESDCALSLARTLEDVDPSVTIREVIDKSLQVDDSFKKLRVAQDWIEKASADQVSDLPASDGISWGETLGRLRNGHRTTVKQLDPDGQLSSNGDVKTLEGADVVEQESALKLVWQCVRSGQIAKAQIAARDQGMFWLAASLMGVADEFHDSYGITHSDARVISVRRGNTRKPKWMNSCFDHADRMCSAYERKKFEANSNAARFSDSLEERGSVVPILEASIYGALSNNVNVLVRSPILTEWTDYLWIAIKSHHERRLHHILRDHRLKRVSQSALYPGCGKEDVEDDGKYLERISVKPPKPSMSLSCQERNKDLVLGACFCGSLSEMLLTLAPRPTNKELPASMANGMVTDAPFAAVCLWQLQVAILGGISTLKRHLEMMLEYFELETCRESEEDKKQSRHGSRFSGNCRLLRVYAHVCIWLRAAPASNPGVSRVVTDSGDLIMHLIVERYIDLLIERRRRSLVALYCVFLPRDQRIGRYVYLMQTLPASNRRIGDRGSTVLSDAPTMEAKYVLNAAADYFRDDLAEITRAVIDQARIGGTESRRHRLASEFLSDSEKNRDDRGAYDSDDEQVLSLAKRGRYEETSGDLKRECLSFETTKATPIKNSDKSGYGNDDMTSSVAVDTADVNRMDTLRWLCIDDQHRPEAVRQTNAFLRQLMLESRGAKTNEMRLLLGKILPENTLEVALDVHKRHCVISRLDDRFFESEYSQLKFWYLADNAIKCFEDWIALKHEFDATSKSLLGGKSILLNSLSRFKPKLLSATQKAWEALNAAIQCQVDEQESSFKDSSGGIRSVWSKGEKCLVERFCSLVRDAVSAVQSGPREELEMSEFDAGLLLLIEELVCRLYGLSPDEEVAFSKEEDIFRDIKVGLSDRFDLTQIHECLRLLSGASSDPTALDSRYHASLEAMVVILKDIQHRREVLDIVLGKLLGLCTDMFLCAGDIMDKLEEKKLFSNFNQRVLSLASLVADENPELQIYKLISPETLRAFLVDITTASINICDSLGKFNVEAY